MVAKFEEYDSLHTKRSQEEERLTDTSRLTNPELDRLIAEQVMEWKPVEQPLLMRRMRKFWRASDGKLMPRGGPVPWSPSTDRNTAAVVLARIEKLELTYQFMCALVKIRGRTETFQLLLATPRELMQASFEAVCYLH